MAANNGFSSPASQGPTQSSSPYASTDFTYYSPEVARHNGPLAAASAGAATEAAASSGGLPISPSAPPLFLNEISQEDMAYVSRYMLVIQLPDETQHGTDQEYEMHALTQEMKKYVVYASAVPVYNHGVHLRYDDITHATEAKQMLESIGYDVVYTNGHTFCVAKCQDTAANDEFEGQIRVSVNVSVHDGTFTARNIADLGILLERELTCFGAIRLHTYVHTDEASGSLVFRVEYNSIDAANRAAQSLALLPVYGHSKFPWAWSTNDVRAWRGPMTSNSPHSRHPRIDDQGRLVGHRHLPQTNIHQLRTQQYDQHNRVRREHIIDGTDVRTTIMLRNIPNKLDWMNLKAILDKHCFGTYDFVYLRIDFRTGCNVGYAFINFNDANGMISILDNLEHRTWHGYRSSKAAEVSYATIQGKEALTTKFRNSSVMQETPFCRPRTFLPYADAQAAGTTRLTGTEVAFPVPDNLLKLQRSIDSARSMGLYPPHGASGMNDHRNRTSTYDRGTPKDLQESNHPYGQSFNMYSTIHNVAEPVKRLVEQWYVENNGQCQMGVIPFSYIPCGHVGQYLSVHNGSPGVIGQPVITQLTRPVRSSAANNPAYMTTPSRGSRYSHPGFTNSK